MSIYLHQPSADLGPHVQAVMARWDVPLSTAPCEYRAHTADFGVEITELLLAKEINTRVKNPLKSALTHKEMWDGFAFMHSAQNMEHIAQHLGIAIKRTGVFYSARDPFIHLPNGTTKLACHSSHSLEAIHRTHSSNLYLNKTAATHTKNQLFNTWSGYTHSLLPHLKEDCQHVFATPPSPFSYAYLEGGNMWIVSNPQSNGIKALIGSDSLHQTLHMLELEQRSWSELAKITHPHLTYQALQNEIAATLTAPEIKALMEEMFAAGLWQQASKSGLIERKLQLDILLMKFLMADSPVIAASDQGWFLKLATKMGAVPPFTWQESDVEQTRSLAAAYQAKKLITHYLIAHDLALSPQDVHFMPQVLYHLDLFMRPGPKHTIFMTNFAFCAELLAALDPLRLTEIDRKHLQRYLVTAQKLDLELGPLLKKAGEVLQQAGFQVIPLPACWMYESETMYQEFPMPAGGWNMNFINALTGWSAKTQRYYYITHGMQVGQRLGVLLMDLFVGVLQHYLPALEVYFIGRNPQDPTDFGEAMDWWNRLETQSGIHCFTLELASKTH